MSSKAVLIDPKDTGRRTLDLKPPVFDANAVARADSALKAMSGQFQQWLEEEIARLQAARQSAAFARWSDSGLEELHGCAHDLKGLGATYEFPIITQLAASLCRLIETPEGKAAARREPNLVEAHVDAIRASARDDIRTNEHPVGRILLAALEARVDALGVAPL